MRVHFVAPKPPARTGIADYAARVSEGLQDLVDLRWTESWNGEPADVVHFELSAGNRAGLWNARRAAKRVPTTVTLHDAPGAAWWPFDPPSDTERHLVRHAIHLPLRSRLHAIESSLLSEVRRSVCLTERGVEAAARAGFPNPVHIPHVSFPCASDARTSAPRALLFGFNYRGRGTAQLDEILAALRAGPVPDATLVVAGGGFGDLRGRPGLEVHDYVPEDALCGLFHGCSVAILPYESGSRYGPFASTSGSLHRAFSHGVPVVAYDVRAIGDEIRAAGGGIVVPPEDVRALAAAVHRLWSHDTEREAAADAARATADAHSPERIGRMFADLWSGLR